MASLNPLQGVLGHRKAAHLLRRLSFRYTKAKVDEMAGQTAAEALATLLIVHPPNLDQPIYRDLQVQDAPIQTWCLPTGQNVFPTDNFKTRPWIVAWWIREALLDPGAVHKLSLFFHQFMQVTVTSALTENFYDYMELMRWNCLRSFKSLASKIILDNCMLRYLNNTTNTKNNPNENFAREFLELFTIGKGAQIGAGDYSTYTEDDIIQAARVFTGVRASIGRTIIDPETGIPKGLLAINQHDTGNKDFSQKFQTVINGGTNATTFQAELDSFVNMVFAKKATALNLVRRLYTTFVGPHISTEIEDDIISPLADMLLANNYEVKPVLERLFTSQHFFDADDSNAKDEIVGSIIRSPLEIALHALSFFAVPIPDPMTQTAQYFTLFSRGVYTRMLLNAGLPLFNASDVAGYPGYYQNPDYSRAWFSSSSIVARYKVSASLLTGKLNDAGNNMVNNQLGTKLDIVLWTRTSGFFSDATNAKTLVTELLHYMLPEKVDDARFNYFYNEVFLNGLPAEDWTYEWENYLTSNNPAEVRIPLERLVNAIMYSPEFQTF